MKGYTIVKYTTQDRYYIEWQGKRIAHLMSWRTARKVCDLLNADRDRRQVKP